MILGFFTHILTLEEKKLIPKELMRRYRLIRNFAFLGAGLLLLSTLPQFWTFRIGGFPIRLYFWYVPFILIGIREVYQKHLS